MGPVLGIDVDADEIRVACADRNRLDLMPEAYLSTDLWFSPDGVACGTLGRPDESVSRWLWALGRESYHPSVEHLARLEGWRPSDDGMGLAAVTLGHEIRAIRSLAELTLEAVRGRVDRAGIPRNAMTLLSVPSAFGPRQTEALQAAAARAGFAIERVLNDTTAVALGAIDDNFWGAALVLKLGESHAEAALCEMAPGMLRVAARVSDPHGGADRTDYRLCDWLIETAIRDGLSHARDPRFRRWVLSRIRVLRANDFAERVMRLPERAQRELPNAGGWELPQGMILHAGRLMAERVVALCRATLKAADKQAIDLARVVVGGSGARSDRVREALNGLFPRGFVEAPLGAAALGAAMHGASLRGDLELRLVQEEPTRALDDHALSDDAPRAPDSLTNLHAHADRAAPKPSPLPPQPSPRRPLPRPPVAVLRAAPSEPDAPRAPPSTMVPPPRSSSTSAPQIPRAPSVPAMPRAPSVPSIPRAPSVPSIPRAPSVPSIPRAPSVPAIPRAPSVPPPAKPSSAPPAAHSGRSSAPPPQHSSHTTSVARHGAFRGALTVSEIRSLPLARTPDADFHAPFPLPYLLLVLSHSRETTGRIVLEHGAESVEMALYQGGPTMTAAELTRSQKAFSWSEGTYTFHPDVVVPSNTRVRQPMLTLVSAHLKSVLRGFSANELLETLTEHLHHAPVIAPEHHARVRRLSLSPVEARMLEHDFTGAMTLQEMVDSNPVSRLSLVTLVFMMELVNALVWPEPVRPAHLQPLALLQKERNHLVTRNHFELIGAHWSASPALLLECYRRFQSEFGPGSQWNKVSPELCQEILAMGAAAWRVLQDDVLRSAYRKAQYPDVDTELLAPLLASRARSLAMRGDAEGVDDIARLLRELSPEEAAALRRDLSGKPKGTV